ncbi:MAG: hypothetical protein GY801_34750, partial [bacterium]|nr:hypothetical protein [bacterium]
DDQKLPGTHLSQSLQEWKVVLAFYASALYRTPIEMSEFHPPNDLFEQLRLALRR